MFRILYYIALLVVCYHTTQTVYSSSALEFESQEIITIKKLVEKVEAEDSPWTIKDISHHRIIAFKSTYTDNPPKIDDLLKIDDGVTSIIFSGYGSGGTLGALAASSLLRKSDISPACVSLITFSASPIEDRELLNYLRVRIPTENMINFCTMPSSNQESLSIQARILPWETIIYDLGRRFLNSIFGKLYNPVVLPSDDTLRTVVSHYQTAYYALKENTDFDSNSKINHVGEVNPFSCNRGFLNFLYSFL